MKPLNRYLAKEIGRERMLDEIARSADGQRVIKECRETFARPANEDDESQSLILTRFACELGVTKFEMRFLLEWRVP